MAGTVWDEGGAHLEALQLAQAEGDGGDHVVGEIQEHLQDQGVDVG